MKKMKKLLLLATVTTLAFTTVGCGVIDSITETIDEKVEDTFLETAWDKIKSLLGIEEEEVVIEPEEPVEEAPVEEDGQLSEDELKEFADYFNAKEHNGLLTSDYHNPEEIDWGWTVYSCGIGYYVESGSDEYEDYCYFSGYDFKKPVNCIPRTELEEYVRTNTGTDYSAATKPLEEAFIEKYDSYFIYHSDFLYKTYRFTEGTKEDDVYTLTYESTGEADGEDEYRILPKQVVVKKVDDTYQVVSNLTLWDTDTNPNHTYDISLPQCQGKCQLFEYHPAEGAADKGVELKIVENDFLFAELPDYTYASSDEKFWNEIYEVDFFDYSGDGKYDAVIIGNRDGKSYVGIYLYTEDGFSMKKHLSAKAVEYAKENDDWTMDGVKKFLLGDNQECKFEDYKEAYKHIAKLAELTGDDYKFELALINDDDEPELVQCSPSNLISVYTFKDGHIETLLEGYLRYDSCISTEYVEKANFILMTNYSEMFENYENEYIVLQGDEKYETFYKEWDEDTADDPSYSSMYKENVSRADDNIYAKEKIDAMDQMVFQDLTFGMSAKDVYKALK